MPKEQYPKEQYPKKEDKEPYILVLYYSRHDSTHQLADAIAYGIEHADAPIQARIRTVAEVSVNYDKDAHAVPLQGPPYATLDDLRHCAGLALGSPTRFANMAAPLRYFLDQTGTLWNSGALIGKPASVFTSTSSMHGGQETTLLSMMLPLIHHGMILVGVPYSVPELMSTQSGGTPYGATHVTGLQNNSKLTADEVKIAHYQGKRLAKITNKLTGNC